MINAQGIIQMANKMMQDLFGYKRGELDGKNVSILMPQPFRCSCCVGLCPRHSLILLG